MFDGIYITKAYGTWFPFKCENETEKLRTYGSTYVNAWTPRTDTLDDNPFEFVCREPIGTSDLNVIYKVVEMYR